jgi:hypothetical protein
MFTGDRLTTVVATLVLDNEAVQALGDVNHPKHRRALAFVEVANQRSGRRRQPVSVVVPVAVRIEAGWDRRAPTAAMLNRISRARDVVLDQSGADRCAEIRQLARVSVVDATVARVAESSPQPAVILTSDASDMRLLAGYVEGDVRAVRL